MDGLLQIVKYRVGLANVIASRNDCLRLRVVDDEGPFGRGQAVIERYQDHTGFGGPKKQQKVLDVICRENGDTVALSETGSDESRRDSVSLS